MGWHVDIDLIKPWLDTQDLVTVSCIEAAIEELERKGPSLGRPLVDHIKDSEFCNMKELRPASPGRSKSAFCLPSIRKDMRSCFSPATSRPEGEAARNGTDGTDRPSPWRKKRYREHLGRLE